MRNEESFGNKFWSNVFSYLSKVGLIFIITLMSAVVINFMIKTSVVNKATRAEAFVLEQYESCVVTYNESVKSIIETAQVDSNTKDFLEKLIENATPEQASQIKEGYQEFVNGNPQPFMMLMSTLSGTNFTITAENTQREINIRRSEMIGCAKQLIASQKNLRYALGMNASNEIMSFPQSVYLHAGYFPSELVDPTLHDNDGDGRLTVFDYTPPVSLEISESFGNGVDNEGTIDIYKK